MPATLHLMVTGEIAQHLRKRVTITTEIEYEEYLKRIAALAKRVEAGQAEDTPAQLNTPGRRALYNNLKQQAPSKDVALDQALRIDDTVKRVRPDGWRGVQAREQVIKLAL